MPDDFEVRGADQFLALSKALKHAGQGDLRRSLHKGVRDAAKPLIAKTRAAFLAEMPKRGGLNVFLARKPVRIVARTGTDPGVTIVVAQEDRRLDSEGRLPHWVFGHGPKVVQHVKPRVFSSAIEREAPAIRVQIEKALEDMAQRIVEEVK